MRALTLLGLVLFLAAARPAAAGADGIEILRDPETRDVTVRIEAPGGRVSWERIARGLARARGFDDGALEGVLPRGDVRVSGLGGWLLLGGLNRVLSPALTFRYAAGGEGETPTLSIHLDRRAILATKRRFLGLLRGAVADAAGKREEFGLKLPAGWETAPKDRRLVVLAHGLHSGPERIDKIIPDIEAMGLTVGMFHYPNDQPLDRSTALLSRELRRVRDERPETSVSLVTHSMGGLVARAVIEDPDLDPGNVRQLIMAAPPTHGSALAEYAFALEVWEFVRDPARRALLERLHARLEDGLGEASADLRPGSAFLERLNARRRNPKVAYSLFLGTEAGLTGKELVELREGITKAGEKNRFVRFFGPKLKGLLDDLEEVVDGKGDGAVAVKRGRLAGVTDVETFPVRHPVAWDDPEDPGSAALRKAVLERLRK